jgi:hypothetical protein
VHVLDDVAVKVFLQILGLVPDVRRVDRRLLNRLVRVSEGHLPSAPQRAHGEERWAPALAGDERATLRWVGGREPLAMQQDELKTDMLETA